MRAKQFKNKETDKQTQKTNQTKKPANRKTDRQNYNGEKVCNIVQQQFFIIRGQYIKGKDKQIKANKFCSILYCTVIGKTKGGSTRD